MAEKKENTPTEKINPTCGIVMPISSIGECTADHWVDVKRIIDDVIESAGFKPNLVSDADDSGIIQKRIIQNLYENEIVVCDVSCKNPNVMFELGLRLAFDKPTIIIKDNKTDYSFDTSVIEHHEYPRDLRFNKIVDFKNALQKKIKATYEKSRNDEDYTTFLKHFGTYKITNLEEKEITKENLILSKLEDLQAQLSARLPRTSSFKSALKNDLEYLKVKRYKLSKAIDQFILSKDKLSRDEIYQNDEILKELFDYLNNSTNIIDMYQDKKQFTDAIEEELLPF